MRFDTPAQKELMLKLFASMPVQTDMKSLLAGGTDELRDLARALTAAEIDQKPELVKE